MAAELVMASEAEGDVSDAYGWYEQRRLGLGEEFLTCVEACIKSICRSPTRHGLVHENFRRALVRRFPYAVFYEYYPDQVIVYCVFHTSRDPEKWRERLSG